MTKTLINALLAAKEEGKAIPMKELTTRGLITHDLILALEDEHIILTHKKDNGRFVTLTLKGYKTLKGGIAS